MLYRGNVNVTLSVAIVQNQSLSPNIKDALNAGLRLSAATTPSRVSQLAIHTSYSATCPEGTPTTTAAARRMITAAAIAGQTIVGEGGTTLCGGAATISIGVMELWIEVI
jgi:hypothetical protein